MQAVEEDHRRMAEELGRNEAEFAIKRPDLERKRMAAITSAQTALATYEKELAPRLAEQEKKRAEATAKLEADLKHYETNTIAKKMADWEKAHAASIVNRWVVLEPKTTGATNRSVLTKEADGSISVSGRNTNGVVTIVAETELTGITGLRLEVLPDSRLPSRGPGRASDGNFVLNELQMTAAPKADPKQAKPVKLEKAIADFSQNDFDISKAIDGSANDQGNGWAISPATGTTHWATFETAQPFGAAGGTVLTIKMSHLFQNVWTLGRFRLSVTPGASRSARVSRRTFAPSWPSPPSCGPRPRRMPFSPTSGPWMRSCGPRTTRSLRARCRFRSIPNSRTCATSSNTPRSRSNPTRSCWPCAAM